MTDGPGGGATAQPAKASMARMPAPHRIARIIHSTDCNSALYAATAGIIRSTRLFNVGDVFRRIVDGKRFGRSTARRILRCDFAIRILQDRSKVARYRWLVIDDPDAPGVASSAWSDDGRDVERSIDSETIV
jgi:hypothetical protein